MRQQAVFKITASCRFWWAGCSGETNFATGMTRDLGAGGVCVISKVLPSLGTTVMIEIDLPRAADASGEEQSDLLLRAEGTVSQHQGSQGEFVMMITYASLDREHVSHASEPLQGGSHASN